MAATVLEKYTYDVTVQEDGSPEQNVKVVAWNEAGTQEFSVLTDVNGDIAQQTVEAASHSVSGFVTTTTDRNPFRIRAVRFGNVTFQIEKNIDAITGASADTFFTVSNSNLTVTVKATVDAYTGITISHAGDSVTLTGLGGTPVNDMNRLYDRLQSDKFDNPQFEYITGSTEPEVLRTPDKINYTMNYDFIVDGFDFDGQFRNMTFGTGRDLTIQGSGGNVSDLAVTGDVNLGTGTGGLSIGNLDVTGALDFSVAGTYTVTDCTIDEVTNSSGGAVTINAVDSSITTNTGPNITINNAVPITITVRDAATNAVIQGARVFLEETPGGTDLINELTNASGQVTDTYNYLSDQGVTGRVRRGTTTPLYKTSPISGTITSTGFEANVFLVTDE